MLGFSQNQKPFVSLLGDLIKLENDMIAAYEMAIQCCENDKYKPQLTKFAQEHEAHVIELNKCAHTANANDFTTEQRLAKGQAFISDLYGDAAILGAMKTNQDYVVTAYMAALERTDLPKDIRAAIEQIYSQEISHRSWLSLIAKNTLMRVA